jgi:hypothetical protein
MFDRQNTREESGSAPGQAMLHRFGDSLRLHGPSGAAVRLLAVITFLFLLATAFRDGWTRPETDFANYYTAAVLVRQHQPLRDFYNWTWFARQMNYAGNETQIGAYTPQTPLTMLPMVGLTRYSPQRAKQIWMLFNLIFLGLTIWLLSRVTRFRFEAIWLLAFSGYFSLRTNFLYGQYYIFLLFLLTLAFYFLRRKNYLLGGSITGIAFGLKLYGGPFLLYFAARRQWKAFIAAGAMLLILVGIALVLFGPANVHYYATQILPRSLEGSSVDPYAPGVPTLSNLLRRSFVADAELNPHPLWQAPWLFFFLRSFVSLAIVALLSLGTGLKLTTAQHAFAWFIIAVLLLSSSTASYTFIVLLLPVVLLLEGSGPRRSIFLVISFVLLTLPLHPVSLFPKVWLLFILFFAVGWPQWRELPPRWVAAAIVMSAMVAVVDARRHILSYDDEPAQHFERVGVQHGGTFSSFPVVSEAGLFYQSMGKDRYVLRWLHDHRDEVLSFEGHALHPRLAPDGQSIYFELVANRSSTMIQFDPTTRKATPLTMAVPADATASVVSPNGKWIAFESAKNGPTQIWLRDLLNGTEKQLTGGNCNSSSPAWELDSSTILFASDCGRAFGLPALYRARLVGTAMN